MQKEMNGEVGILTPVREFMAPFQNGGSQGGAQGGTQGGSGNRNGSNINKINNINNGSSNSSMNGQENFPHNGALTRTIGDIEDIPDHVLGPLLQSPHLEVIGVTSALPREGKEYHCSSARF